jgi:hypothetical protein
MAVQRRQIMIEIWPNMFGEPSWVAGMNKKQRSQGMGSDGEKRPQVSWSDRKRRLWVSWSNGKA